MVMSHHPKRPDGEQPPAYDGPTSAERFVDDIAANQALRRAGLPIPDGFELPAIRRRYLVCEVQKDEDGKINRVLFMDSSAAKLNRRKRWVVN